MREARERQQRRMREAAERQQRGSRDTSLRDCEERRWAENAGAGMATAAGTREAPHEHMASAVKLDTGHAEEYRCLLTRHDAVSDSHHGARSKHRSHEPLYHGICLGVARGGGLVEHHHLSHAAQT